MTGLLRPSIAAPHLLGTGGAAGQGTSPTLKLTLGHPGSCPTDPTLCIFIFDDSGSMLGGSDSTGLRYLEATIALEKVTARCRCDRELAAILHMNRPNSADRPASPINRRNKSDLTSGLTVPTDGDGASTIGDTLHRAEKIAHAHPHHRTTLVAFSDYELTDHLTTLANDLADFPGDVHAVVMRSTPPTELLNHDHITTTHIAGAEPAGPVAHTIFDALTTHRPGHRPATKKATTS